MLFIYVFDMYESTCAVCVYMCWGVLFVHKYAFVVVCAVW